MRSAVLVLVLGVAATGAAGAQRAMRMDSQMAGNESVVAAIMSPVTGEPYKAEETQRSVQTLADGTRITHETTGLVARDAVGRMRQDLYVVMAGSVDGRQVNRALASATVGDPVGRTLLIWTGKDGKVAVKMELPAELRPAKPGLSALLVAPPPPPPPPPPPGSGQTASVRVAPRVEVRLGKNDAVRTEELGKQSMEGLLVTGKRTTTTIATGQVGNDRPIEVVHEEWRSPELQILVKTVDTDPRTGVQTMELHGVLRTEPDAALFQVPAGFEVKDMAEMMRGMGGAGKAKTE